MNYERRIKKVQAYLDTRRLPDCVIAGPANIFYLTGLLRIPGYLVINRGTTRFFVSRMQIQEVRDKIEVAQKEKVQVEEWAAFPKFLSTTKQISFIPSEISYSTFQNWQKKTSARLIPLSDFILNMRAVKEPEELVLIEKAYRISCQVGKEIKKLLKPGMRELDVAAEICYLSTKYGGDRPAFPPIVAGGPNSVYPHHEPTNRKLKEGEAVVIDWGVELAGYQSDITKTFLLGKVPSALRKIHKLVEKVKKECINQAKSGISAAWLHHKALQMFKSEGFSQYFLHSLGHGVGIEIHEKPILGPKSKDILKPGMVFTIEPGIYLPGLAGVRSESMVSSNAGFRAI